MNSWESLIDRAWLEITPSLVAEGARDRLVEYIEVLVAWDKVHNLTAMRDAGSVVENLVLPSMLVAAKLSNYSRLLDLGTGAGVPGLIAAILFTKQQWVLVERVQKKTAFLKHVVHMLALNNITVFSGDFHRMVVDQSIEAIVTRGSAKLAGQLDLTGRWRALGVPLYSVQTAKSLDESGVSSCCDRQDMPGLFGDAGLVLVKVK